MSLHAEIEEESILKEESLITQLLSMNNNINKW